MKTNFHKSYVLITAAKNEEAYIEKTILSVISQTVLPKKWVIVSDGSTDGTDNIVSYYENKYDFIQLLRRTPKIGRSFASKAMAIREGIQLIQGLDYDLIGNIDADVSFNPNYYKCILMKFDHLPKLGIAGGQLYEKYIKTWIPLKISRTFSVSGPIQMFRKKCYEDIGGYRPLKMGGVDGIAEVMARMNGWEVKTFEELVVIHHRSIGTGERNILKAKFWDGSVDYSHGNHPLFELAKFLFRFSEKPIFFASLMRLCGYVWALIKNVDNDVPEDVVRYLRKEQIDRITNFLR